MDASGQLLFMNVTQGSKDDGQTLKRAADEASKTLKPVEENNDEELELHGMTPQVLHSSHKPPKRCDRRRLST